MIKKIVMNNLFFSASIFFAFYKANIKNTKACSNPTQLSVFNI